MNNPWAANWSSILLASLRRHEKILKTLLKINHELVRCFCSDLPVLLCVTYVFLLLHVLLALLRPRHLHCITPILIKHARHDSLSDIISGLLTLGCSCGFTVTLYVNFLELKLQSLHDFGVIVWFLGFAGSRTPVTWLPNVSTHLKPLTWHTGRRAKE
jgi:hypothetical protein